MLVWMNEFIDKFLDTVLSVLPHSPFSKFISAFQSMPYLSYLNWFFPVSQALSIMRVWLSAVALFYCYSLLMRWLKLIGD